MLAEFVIYWILWKDQEEQRIGALWKLGSEWVQKIILSSE